MTTPLLIEGTNLSNAWVDTLTHICSQSGKEISPLILSITGFEETQNIRESLDLNLLSNKLPSIQTVSETIFPESLYMFCGMDRNCLYNEYKNNFIRIQSIDKKSNRRGTYFQRLIDYEGYDNKSINQIEIIISSLQQTKVKRRSKLQASIFNPNKDHTSGMFQGFPCLQHITFYKSEDNGLILNSFYAVQYLYKRAYGNWLGLINLGKFVANELGIGFERFNCHIGVEILDNLTKAQASTLLKEISTE